MSNIRNSDQHENSAWDWDFLNKCFVGTRIRVSDIDGIVERFGHFLAIETKAPGKDLEEGQKILWQNWKIENSRRHRFLVLRGPRNKVQEYKTYDVGNRKWREWKPTTTEEVQGWVSDWFKEVNHK